MSAEGILIRYVLTVLVLAIVYTPLSFIIRRRRIPPLWLWVAGAVAGAVIGAIIVGPEFDPPAAAIFVILLMTVATAVSTFGTSRMIDRMFGRVT